MPQQRIGGSVTGRREGRGRTGSTGGTSDTDTRGIGSGLQAGVTGRGDPTLAAGQPQGRRRGQNPAAGAAAGRRNPLRVLRIRRRRQRRRPVDVRRLSLPGTRGRCRIDGRRFRSAEDAGDAEGRVLRIAGGPERRLADRVEAKRVMMIVQAAAGLAVLLLQQQFRRRGTAPGALQFQILLRYDRHLDLRLAGHPTCLSTRGDPLLRQSSSAVSPASPK